MLSASKVTCIFENLTKRDVLDTGLLRRGGSEAFHLRVGKYVFPMRNSRRVKFIEHLVCSCPRTYLKCFTCINLNLVATLRFVVISIQQMKTLRHCKFKSLAYAAADAAAKSPYSCPTLCDPRDGSPPGSPIPGILQASVLMLHNSLLKTCSVQPTVIVSRVLIIQWK